MMMTGTPFPLEYDILTLTLCVLHGKTWWWVIADIRKDRFATLQTFIAMLCLNGFEWCPSILSLGKRNRAFGASRSVPGVGARHSAHPLDPRLLSGRRPPGMWRSPSRPPAVVVAEPSPGSGGRRAVPRQWRSPSRPPAVVVATWLEVHIRAHKTTPENSWHHHPIARSVK